MLPAAMYGEMLIPLQICSSMPIPGNVISYLVLLPGSPSTVSSCMPKVMSVTTGLMDATNHTAGDAEVHYESSSVTPHAAITLTPQHIAGYSISDRESYPAKDGLGAPGPPCALPTCAGPYSTLVLQCYMCYVARWHTCTCSHYSSGIGRVGNTWSPVAPLLLLAGSCTCTGAVKGAGPFPRRCLEPDLVPTAVFSFPTGSCVPVGCTGVPVCRSTKPRAAPCRSRHEICLWTILGMANKSLSAQGISLWTTLTRGTYQEVGVVCKDIRITLYWRLPYHWLN